MSRTPNDDRSDRFNPNNDAYWAAEANESRDWNDDWDEPEPPRARLYREPARAPNPPPVLPPGKPKAWLLGADVDWTVRTFFDLATNWFRYGAFLPSPMARPEPKFSDLDAAVHQFVDGGVGCLTWPQRTTLACVLAWAPGGVDWDHGVRSYNREIVTPWLGGTRTPLDWPNMVEWRTYDMYPHLVAWLADDRPPRSMEEAAERTWANRFLLERNPYVYFERELPIEEAELMTKVRVVGLEGLVPEEQRALCRRLLLGSRSPG